MTPNEIIIVSRILGKCIVDVDNVAKPGKEQIDGIIRALEGIIELVGALAKHAQLLEQRIAELERRG